MSRVFLVDDASSTPRPKSATPLSETPIAATLASDARASGERSLEYVQLRRQLLELIIKNEAQRRRLEAESR